MSISETTETSAVLALAKILMRQADFHGSPKLAEDVAADLLHDLAAAGWKVERAND
ncbi:protein of unknown function [Rhodovastum atsumiense]|uniref:hypothetical protein n=1 Tax=Rhodovastum atsumiense TaxID=504468 RepID=UPI00139F2B22|nr:hypothetical protein [Rhodovastum atsumiense]CAH2602306.1 protein of unknown function [Rhodovastum atsumiense]